MKIVTKHLLLLTLGVVSAGDEGLNMLRAMQGIRTVDESQSDESQSGNALRYGSSSASAWAWRWEPSGSLGYSPEQQQGRQQQGRNMLRAMQDIWTVDESQRDESQSGNALRYGSSSASAEARRWEPSGSLGYSPEQRELLKKLEEANAAAAAAELAHKQLYEELEEAKTAWERYTKNQTLSQDKVSELCKYLQQSTKLQYTERTVQSIKELLTQSYNISSGDMCAKVRDTYCAQSVMRLKKRNKSGHTVEKWTDADREVFRELLDNKNPQENKVSDYMYIYILLGLTSREDIQALSDILKANIQGLKKQLDSLDTSGPKYCAAINTTRDNADKLKTRKNSEHSARDTLLAQVNTERTDLQNATRQVADKNTTYINATGELDKAQGEYNTAKEVWKATTAQLNKKNDEVRELEERMQRLRAQNTEAQDALDQADDDNRATAQTSLDEVQDSIRTATTDKTKADEDVTNLKIKQENERAEMDRQETALNAALDAQQKALASWNAEVAKKIQIEKSCAAKEIELLNLNANIDRMRTDLIELAKTEKEQTEKMNALHTTSMTLNSRLEEQKIELKDIEDIGAKLAKAKDSRITDARREIESLSRQTTTVQFIKKCTEICNKHKVSISLYTDILQDLSYTNKVSEAAQAFKQVDTQLSRFKRSPVWQAAKQSLDEQKVTEAFSTIEQEVQTLANALAKAKEEKANVSREAKAKAAVKVAGQS